jgi:hypothetical protein
VSNVVIKDHLPAFSMRLKGVFDDALREVAQDIIEESKMKAPFKDGMLRASASTQATGRLSREVTYGNGSVQYAGAQEAGQTRGYRIRRYTTAGTGAHFLKNTGDKYAGTKIIGKFIKHAQRVRI